MQRDPIAALILAGGTATRLGGVDERELVLAGRTIAYATRWPRRGCS